MTAILSGMGWCAMYLGTLFGSYTMAGGSPPDVPFAYFSCALAGWVTVRGTKA